MPATGALGDVAVTVNPAGAPATKSPWLAHTLSDFGMSCSSRDPFVIVTSAWPNSRLCAGATWPPSVSVINCMP
jgi:hypothetical protein